MVINYSKYYDILQVLPFVLSLFLFLVFFLCYLVFTLVDKIGENMNTNEFLVTAQIYEKKDPYKQTVLICDVFNTNDSDEAKKEFTTKYSKKYKIVNIFSSVKVTEPQHWK